MARIIGAALVGMFGGILLILFCLHSLGALTIETRPLIIVPVLQARPVPEPTPTPVPTRTPDEIEEGKTREGVRVASHHNPSVIEAQRLLESP